MALPPANRSASRLTALAQLVRLPNLFTAAADILAGFFLAGAGAPAGLLFLVPASMAIYGGGCALNDFHDRECDRHARPERPIPSGRITAACALAAAVAFLAIGWSLAALAGPGPRRTATVLVVLVLAYDLAAKHHRLAGPLVMGGCRGANLLLGAGGTLNAATTTAALAATGYVGLLTWLARHEDFSDGGGAAVATLGWLGIAVAVFLPAAATLGPSALFFALLFAAIVLAGLAQAATGKRPVTAAVARMILGLVLLDGFWAAVGGGWWAGVGASLCLLPAAWGKRRFAMT